MTRTEFNNQWNRYFAPLTNEVIPSYDKFRVSERMLEDYLDIFRGYNSRDGNVEMPYDHPFFNSNETALLDKKPCIQYILIGEARPKSTESNFPYFYNIYNTNHTHYVSAPRINWDCPIERPNSENKRDTLLCLASKGVLLLDLFPFAIPYGLIRSLLNDTGVTKNYWDNPDNPYSLSNRINSIKGLLCDDWDLSLIAPCIISGHIINPNNDFPPIATIPAGLHPEQFRTLMPDPTRCRLGADWRKVAVSSAGAPTQNLISISF
jgi:hypothetical protein